MDIISDPRSLYGEIPLSSDISIAYDTNSFQFPSDSNNPSKISNLLESCVPSGFGMNERTIIDNSYRCCKELKPENFKISNNYQELIPGIVAQVANVLEAPKQIYPSLNKLCVYDTHGFFKEHVDTPRTNIFASLVICLPTNYEGGFLIVEDESFDLSSSTSVKWCAFFSDCKHRIEEVTKGFRVTLTYDLLYFDLPKLFPKHDHLYQTLESSIRKLYQDNNVNPDQASEQVPKFVIGIPFVSKYPTLSALNTGVSDTTKPTLKGIDRKTLAILHDLGFKTDLKAVYKVTVYSYIYGEADREPISGLGDIYTLHEAGDMGEDGNANEEFFDNEYYLFSDVWNGWTREVDEQHDDNVYSALYELGGRILGNIHWLRQPTCSHVGGNYIAYGNSASSGVVYMDGCILAYK